MLKLDDFRSARRILILGDSGSGKTTLALKLGDELGLPVFHSDDALWQRKFSIMRNRGEAVMLMDEIYAREYWIAEGTTKDLLRNGIERADSVIFVYFQSALRQYASIIKRHFIEKNGSFRELLQLLVWVSKKRFRLTKKSKETLFDIAKRNPDLHVERYPVDIVEG